MLQMLHENVAQSKGDICRKELIIEVEGVSDEKHKI